MNATEFRTVLLRVSAIEPAYHQWIQAESSKLAATTRITADDAYASMRSEWLLAVADYTPEEINAVLDDVAATKQPLPSYSKLWRTIAGYAADARAVKREAERARRDERRFHCLDCMDSGSVVVYNPKFVAWLAPKFIAWQAAREFPANWYADAVREWYRKVIAKDAKAPAEVPLVCRCNCPDAVIYRRQLERMRESMDDPKAKPVRAAYIGQWTQGVQCVKTFDAHADLTAWFDEHPPASDEWAPQPGEYERQFA